MLSFSHITISRNKSAWLAVVVIAPMLFTACDKQGNSGGISKNSGNGNNTAMVLVPAGEFIRGSNKVDNEGVKQRFGFANDLYLDEHPQTKLRLDDFMIDVYEVSNLDYKNYILASKKMMPYAWVNNGYALTEGQMQKMDLEKLRKLGTDYFRLDMDTRLMDKAALIKAMLQAQQTMDKKPVSNVNWFDASAYCKWRSARLPSEVEWEKAARGPNGLEFPWGNEFDPKITNTGDDSEWEDGIAPIGAYPNNKSPYGAYDMSGNVWEWVSDWYRAYPGSDYKNPLFGEENRVIRGGGGGVGHYAIAYFFRGATRQFSEPGMESDDVGFRCAKDA